MKLIFYFAVLLISVAAHADRTCGGTCVNTSTHKFMTTVCGDAQESEIKCEQFSLLGCAWKQATKKIVRAGTCSNGSFDRTLDLSCSSLSPAGAQACVKISGCVWSPAAYSCEK